MTNLKKTDDLFAQYRNIGSRGRHADLKKKNDLFAQYMI